MSAIQSLSGEAVKALLTRFAAGTACLARRVVRFLHSPQATPDADSSHQSSDPLSPAADADGPELGMYPRRAVGSSTALINLANFSEDLQLLAEGLYFFAQLLEFLAFLGG